MNEASTEPVGRSASVGTGFSMGFKATKVTSALPSAGHSRRPAKATISGFNAFEAADSKSKKAAPAIAAASDEVDPLDAFMAGIHAEVAKTDEPKSKPKAGWEDLEAEDGAVSYLEAFERGETKKKVADNEGLIHEDAAEVASDSEEEGDRRKKGIEPLPRIDHSQIKYSPMRTDFYEVHPEINELAADKLNMLRTELRVSATGSNVANPVASFAHLAPSLGKELMDGIQKHGFSTPTPIQAQAIPVGLGGRDIIGIAETGSGKTIAFLLPLLVHAASQPELKKDEGPIGLVLCPTRELAVQIENEVFGFNKQLGLRSVTLAGGLSKLEQFKQIKRGCEIVIANPGRLIDIIKMKGCNLLRCTFLVLDEADRMLNMGFESQVRSIVQNLRPTRQILLFSATFPPKIERLARDLLQSPVRITIGEGGQAAANITQKVVTLQNDDEKWPWLSKHVNAMLAKGQLLVFAKSIASAEELTQNFTDFMGKKPSLLHGDLDQFERMAIIRAMRKKECSVLIATDVASRGLDIPSIATVVSYDVARDIETHTHRVGRTGRAGAVGEAFTLINDDKEHAKMAALIVEMLEGLNQEWDKSLENLANKFPPYRAAKLSGEKFSSGRRKGTGKGTGKVEKSAKGLAFDGQAMKEETVEDLEKRLNKEADALCTANRLIMQEGLQPKAKKIQRTGGADSDSDS